MAADVEIHFNERFYILDLGRFLPPNNPRNPFLDMFRIEWIQKKFNEKISPDVFSGFGKTDKDKYNQICLREIEELNNYIENEIWVSSK